MSYRAENVAALVNGLLVLLMPIAFLAIGSCLNHPNSQYSVTVRPSGPPDPVLVAETRLEGVRTFGRVALATLPFAAIAAWADTGPRETLAAGKRLAGRCGGGHTRFRHRDPLSGTRNRHAADGGAPYILVYGGGALILGLLVGLVLRLSAVFVLVRANQLHNRS